MGGDSGVYRTICPWTLSHYLTEILQTLHNDNTSFLFVIVVDIGFTDLDVFSSKVTFAKIRRTVVNLCFTRQINIEYESTERFFFCQAE